jgi:hypothetical protein
MILGTKNRANLPLLRFHQDIGEQDIGGSEPDPLRGGLNLSFRTD